jgi:hydrogenase nickel incorporation protein HypB
MCETCGCGQPDDHVTIRKPGEEHSHDHNDHLHDHEYEHHEHVHTHSHEILLEQDIMQKNNLLAERNRGYF